MKELTKEQTIKYLTQFINEFGYQTLNDFVQHQRNQLASYENKTNTFSAIESLEIKGMKPPYRWLCIRIDCVNKNIVLRNYNVFDNDMTISFNELNNLDRIEKLKTIIND